MKYQDCRSLAQRIMDEAVIPAGIPSVLLGDMRRRISTILFTEINKAQSHERRAKRKRAT